METIEAPKNPAASLDALAATAELTLGKMAVLTRINSPILIGRAADIPSTLTALWIIAMPFEEVLAHRDDLETPALKWGERMEPAEYRKRIIAALSAVDEYYKMLPRPDADSKKKSRERKDRRARRVALPHLRVDAPARPPRTPGRPGRAPLAVLGTGARRPQKRHPRGR